MIKTVSSASLSAVTGLVLVNYFIMVGYDFFGLRYAGSKLPFKKILFTSFVGDSLNANLGFSAVVGSIVKLRFYTTWGEKVPTIMRAIALYTVGYWLGFSALLSISLFFVQKVDLIFKPEFKTLLAVCFALPVLIYLILIFSCSRKTITIKKVKIEVPSPLTGLGLLAVGIADWLCTAAIFFIIMSSHTSAGFFKFANSYIWAHLVGMISQLPGGIAVFESAVIMLNGGNADTATAASLLLFRIFFFIIPFTIALGLFIYFELKNLFFGNDTVSKKKQIIQPSGTLPKVTVVVPAYNEESSIEICLQSLKNQDYKGPLEITVIDNNSTDSTADIARRAGCTVIHESRQGYNFAIKRGFDDATGDIIACTDADTRVPSDWISRIVTILSKNSSAVACSGTFSFLDGPFWLKCVGILGRLNYHLAGANMAVLRSAYQQCGGISLKVNLGADVDLGIRLKKFGKVIIDRSLVVETSSRRFQCAFWETIVRYYLNDASLLLRGKPIFYSFKDYRINLSRINKPWKIGFAGGSLAIMIGTGWLLQSPSNQMLGTVFSGGELPQSNPLIALTFDNGPGKSTDSILSILDRYNAQATFFVVGKNALEYPQVLKKIHDKGHEIGNHTLTNRYISVVGSKHLVRNELDSTASIINSICGVETHLFRPPHGWRSPWMMNECRTMNYTVVTWTFNSEDWHNSSAEQIIENVKKHVRPGSVLLFHDRESNGKDKTMDKTLQTLPYVLETLSNQGYKFVSISELKSNVDHYLNNKQTSTLCKKDSRDSKKMAVE